MKFKVVLWASAVLLMAVPTLAQRAKTVTNMDLEKYKQQRLRAEREYTENYARLGFPSPEELRKQVEKSRVEREALATRLAAERLQREQIEAELAEAARLSQESVYIVPSGGSDGGYYFGWPGSYYYNFNPRRPRIRQYGPPVTVGNGIPIRSYGYPPLAPLQPAVRMGRP